MDVLLNYFVFQFIKEVLHTYYTQNMLSFTRRGIISFKHILHMYVQLYHFK